MGLSFQLARIGTLAGLVLVCGCGYNRSLKVTTKTENVWAEKPEQSVELTLELTK